MGLLVGRVYNLSYSSLQMKAMPRKKSNCSPSVSNVQGTWGISVTEYHSAEGRICKSTILMQVGWVPGPRGGPAGLAKVFGFVLVVNQKPMEMK